MAHVNNIQLRCEMHCQNIINFCQNISTVNGKLKVKSKYLSKIIVARDLPYTIVPLSSGKIYKIRHCRKINGVT